MNFKDVLDLYYERGNAMQTYWGFYITVALGLIAFVAGAEAVARLRTLKALLTVAFLAFAAVNLNSLWAVTEQRNAAADLLLHHWHELMETPAPVVRQILEKGISVQPVGGLLGFHITANVLTVAAIWLISWVKQLDSAKRQRA